MNNYRDHWVVAVGAVAILGTMLLAACSAGSSSATGMMRGGPTTGAHSTLRGMPNGHMTGQGAEVIPVMLSDFAVTPMVATLPAGTITFRIMNRGGTMHELVVLRTDADAGSLPVTEGKAGETGHVGEVQDIAPGSFRTLTLTLSPGRYLLICNLSGHYDLGMRAGLAVTG